MVGERGEVSRGAGKQVSVNVRDANRTKARERF